MITTLERVGLGFDIQNIASMRVNGNILVIISNTGKIIAIDLFHPESVNDIQVPLHHAGTVTGLFQDPTGTHLLVSSSSREVFYIKDLNGKIKSLSRLKNIPFVSVAWNPAEPERNTGEILLGAEDGNIYETMIDSSGNDYLKREDRYLKKVWSSDNSAITGIYAFQPRGSKHRQVVAYSQGKIWSWWGEFALEKHRSSDHSPRYTSLFQSDSKSTFKDYGKPHDESEYCFTANGNTFAFTCSKGVMCGTFNNDPSSLGSPTMTLFDIDTVSGITALLVSSYHLFVIESSGRVRGFNRLNKKPIFAGQADMAGADDQLPKSDHLTNTSSSIAIEGGCCDPKFNTFWIYGVTEILELKLEDEDADIWKIWLEKGEFEKALSMTGDDGAAADLVKRKYAHALMESDDPESFRRAAVLFGQSTEPFESVALELLKLKTNNDANIHHDALKNFLQTRMRMRNQTPLQQKIISSWLVEVYMEQLDEIDDQLALLISDVDDKGASERRSAAEIRRAETKTAFQQFVTSNTKILDKGTVYEIISSHGRRAELLYYATSIGDTEYVVGYWIRNEAWTDALQVLLKENEVSLVYRYATVLLTSSPKETVDTWMLMTSIEPEKLIGPILQYSSIIEKSHSQPISGRNQAIRYIEHVIDRQKCRDISVNNALIVLYAKSKAETELVKYLTTHRGIYDDLFALRTCWQTECIKSTIYILSSMSLYQDAIQLALDKDEMELAYQIAESVSNQNELCKQLWMKIVERVLKKTLFVDAVAGDNSKQAVNSAQQIEPIRQLLERCTVLNIEDILGLLPEFTSIDEIKDQVITSMERYNNSIGQLTREMDESLITAQHIQSEMKQFSKRHVLIEPGEQCCLCGFPVATRWFYVFPCQHSFHFDCLVKELSTDSSIRSKLADVKLNDPTAEKILARQCVLCSETRLDTIDRPLVYPGRGNQNQDLWTL